MVEAAPHEVGVIDESRLDGVGQSDPEHQIASTSARILSGGQRHAEIVRRMASLALREEVVHEVNVAHQCGVPESCVDRVRLAAADQRTRATATEIRDLRLTRQDRASAQGGNGAAERIQNVDGQLLARFS